ncbi:MAG: gluconokinase [Rhodospirillales bacterium]
MAPPILLLMGVAGSGKTTVAQELARALGCEFQEGDALHPPANVAKMRAGTPLDDADRMPWLDKIAAHIDAWRKQGQGGVITCSALKRAYRDAVIGGRNAAPAGAGVDVRLVYLKGSHELIRARMAKRRDHYMPLALLDSQFAALQEPAPDEHAIVVGIDATPDEIAARTLAAL